MKTPKTPKTLLRGLSAATLLALGLTAPPARAQLLYGPGSLPGGDLAASVAVHVWHPAFAFFILSFLLFPHGRLLSPRWRVVA